MTKKSVVSESWRDAGMQLDFSRKIWDTFIFQHFFFSQIRERDETKA
jgi:hypothetical protein